MKITPVILSGGAGSRLWPLSREALPKQFLPLITQRSMIQDTVCRFQGAAFADPVFICNAQHVNTIRTQMQAIDQPIGAIITEPVGRNTAPCAVVAAEHVRNHNPDGLVLLVPADHYIGAPQKFQTAITQAVSAAQAGYLVTFGIQPDRPETGYGYIAMGERLDRFAFHVSAFREKPDLETAHHYLKSGQYVWNAGLFLFMPGALRTEIDRYAPQIGVQAAKAYAKAQKDRVQDDPNPGCDTVYALDANAFAACPADSIDYAVMEHSDQVAIVPCDIGWSDVGSFTALRDLQARDSNHSVKDKPDNMVQASRAYLSQDSENCLVISDSLPVSIAGLSNIAVIVHNGEILVLDLAQSQSVKDIVEALKSGGETERL